MLDLYVDADACPVKDEIYRVAERYGLKVFVVANMWMRVPDHTMIELVTVADGLDVADDWIAERAGEGDIAITADIPLAARCVKNGSRAIGPSGQPFHRRQHRRRARHAQSDDRAARKPARSAAPAARLPNRIAQSSCRPSIP